MNLPSKDSWNASKISRNTFFIQAPVLSGKKVKFILRFKINSLYSNVNEIQVKKKRKVFF